MPSRTSFLQDWYRTYKEAQHEYTRESIIYEILKKGPVFETDIEAVISREGILNEVKRLITPMARGQLYPLIIGEHGTGKTSLI
jgi:transcriptional regulator with PAS, ATPase and Fis domain